MKNYVLGFMYDESRDLVLLMKKERPAWQAGYLNGVGGKQEEKEIPREAMRREFLEETGIDYEHWVYGALLHGQDSTGGSFVCNVYYAHTNLVFKAKSITDESVELVQADHLANLKERVIENLLCIVPHGQSFNDGCILSLYYPPR